MGAILDSLEEAAKFICAAIYLIHLNLSNNNTRRLVIYYHSVKKPDVARFQKQMEYLAKKCHVVRASEIMDTPAKGKDSMVAITFDDAFVNVLEYAVPILKLNGLPASMFVATGSLGRPPKWSGVDRSSDKDEVVMNEEQIKGLDKAGYEILSHTVSHCHLTEFDDTKLKAELHDSKQALERIVGHNIPGISYPYGACDAKICKAAKQADYQIGFSTEQCLADASSDNFQVGRFMVSPTDGMLKFRLKIRGAYQIVKYLKRLKRVLIGAQETRPSDICHTG